MIEAATVCAVTKLLLTTMPYRIVDSLTAEISRGADDRSLESNREEIDRLIRAVNAAGRFIPGAKNCLGPGDFGKSDSWKARILHEPPVWSQKGRRRNHWRARLAGGWRTCRYRRRLRPDFMCRWLAWEKS